MLELLLGNSFLSAIIAFAIILIPAIIIHELGHFIAAKMVGISVLEFGVGFPPRMVRLFWWGETEFTLNWLPIGGFVRPLGEDMVGPVVEQDVPPDDDEYDEDKPKNITYISEREELMARGVPEHKLQSVNETKPWARIWFMVAGAVFNVVSAVIFFIIAALTGIPTFVGHSLLLVDIPETSVFNQEQVFQYDVVERVDGEYFTTYGEFFSLINDANGTVELTMRHTNNVDTIEEATRDSFETYTITVSADDFTPTPYVLVTRVVEESPADEAGLQAEDRIISVNGKELDVDDPIALVTEETNEFAGEAIELLVENNGEVREVLLTPRLDPPPGQGRIGIEITAAWGASDGTFFTDAVNQIEYIPQSLPDSVAFGFNQTWDILKQIAGIIPGLINGEISGGEARPVSIVGISQIGGVLLQNSIRNSAPYDVLWFIAIVSIFLGVTNLLPFPPLDGGRILFVLIEIVRGKPVPVEVENMIYRIGIALLLLLGVIVIIFDIVNPLDLG
ncbi:MAG: RIP metalloprotease RseP [Chloroflexota bacterium]